MSYYTFGEIDSIHQMMRTYRGGYTNNPTLSDLTYQAIVIDEDGNEYKFKHSHSDDLQHGRPLPIDIRDCPRPGGIIDPLTGECTDVCQYQHDCALGYSCRDGQCLRESCKSNSNCSSNSCKNGVCQPIQCNQHVNTHVSEHGNIVNDVNTVNQQLVMAYPPHGKFVQATLPEDVCVSTSHYHLKGRSNLPNIAKDPRYLGMYN